jgi:hypothetical protein
MVSGCCLRQTPDPGWYQDGVWWLCGVSAVSVWCQCGACVVSAWCQDGVRMNGVRMVSGWCPRQTPDPVWCQCGVWCLRGNNMVLGWCPRGVGVVPVWCQDGIRRTNTHTHTHAHTHHAIVLRGDALARSIACVCIAVQQQWNKSVTTVY